MYKPWLVYAAIVMLLILSLENVEGLSVSAKPEGSVLIDPYDLMEVGIKLREGQTISYSYDASAPVIFMLHRHEGTQVITHDMTEKKSYSGEFSAPIDGDYYILWENSRTFKINVSYKVSLPKSVQQINYGDKVYDIEMFTNSKVYGMQFNATAKQLTFTMETPYLTPGFLSMTVPEELLSREFSVTGGQTQYAVDEKGTSHIIVSTGVGTQDVIINGSNAVPEFGFSVMILSISVTILLSWRFLRNKLY